MAGRPKGRRSGEIAIIRVVAPRCPKCKSTMRSGYVGTTEMELTGMADGLPYDRLIRRRCRCTVCGESRVEESFEYSGPKCEPRISN